MKDLKILLFTFFLCSFQVFSHAQLADVNEACAPFTVNFTPPAGAGSFYWEFGDNTTSTLQTPGKTYTNPGQYIIIFRESQGGPEVARDTVDIFEKPVISFEADPVQGCLPLNVSFTNTSTVDPRIDVSGYRWTFGNGRTNNAQNPSETYTQPGVYDISLQINSNTPECSVTGREEDFITVGRRPIASFITSPSPPVSCEPPLTVSFTNTSISPDNRPLTFEWDFGNSNTSTEMNPGSQDYTTIDTFPVTLTVTDNYGCTATTTTNVSIGSLVADFELPDTVCAGVPVIIQNKSTLGASYTWSFGADADVNLSDPNRPEVTFWVEGDRQVSLTVEGGIGNCSADTTMTLYVENVDASFELDPTYSCSDPTVYTMTRNSTEGDSVRWQFNDGSRSTEQNPTYTWTNPDTTIYGINGRLIDTIGLTVFKTVGNMTCTFFDFVIDTIHLPNALFRPDTTMGCAPLTVEFEDLSTSNEDIVTWTYLWGDNTSDTYNNNDPVTHTFDQPGEYPVRLIIENEAGCLDTSYAIIIEVGEPLSPDFTVDKTTVCQGDTVQFTDLTNDPRVDDWHYSSEDDRLWHCAGEPNPTWAFDSETGLMDVTLTVLYNGCPSTITKSDLIEVSGPIAGIDYLIECGSPYSVMFSDSSQDATTVKWYFGDGDSSDVNNPMHTYADTGDYEVVLVAENATSGCPASMDTVMVHIRDIQASFELPEEVCSGTPIDLNATESEGVNATCWKGYTWFLSDSRPITTQDSVIQYAFGAPGKQWARLVVEDINGCMDTISDTIMVYLVEPAFSVSDTTICLPATITFMDMSMGNGNLVSWEWNFGDGNTSTDRNPTHTYGNIQPPPGQYVVTLEVKDDHNCPGTATIPIRVYKPESEILLSDDELCVGDMINFNARNFTAEGSFLNFEWFLNNTPLTTNQMGTQVFNDAGVFTLRLEFEEDATGCSDMLTREIRVQDYPDAEYTTDYDDDPFLCANSQVIFTADAGQPGNVVFDWDFGGGGSPIFNDPAGEVGESFPEGIFTITAIAETSFGCRDTFARDYDFRAPNGMLVADTDSICRGGIVNFEVIDTSNVDSYNIDLGDGTIVENTTSVTHTYPNNMVASYTAILTLNLNVANSNQTCTVEDEVVIHVYDLSAEFEISGDLCNGGTITFTPQDTSDIEEYIWDFGDGNTKITTVKSADNIYNENGTYIVTLTAISKEGCEETSIQTVTIGGGIEVTTFGDGIICDGSSVEIGVIDPLPSWTFEWSPSSGLSNPDSSRTFATPSTTATYTVEVTDTSGCKGTGMVTVEVLDNNLTPDSLLVIAQPGERIRLPVLTGVNLTDHMVDWNPDIDCSGDSCLAPIATVPDDPMMDSVLLFTAYVSSECGIDTFYRVVRILKIPNVFTPGTDGVNDFFNVVIPGGIQEAEVEDFRIYNRWGQKVYDNENPGQGWDGRYNGEAQPSDTYTYIVVISRGDGTSAKLSGGVTLLR